MKSLFENRRIPHVLVIAFSLANVVLLQGCMHDEDDTPPPAPTYSIGGTITGLTGTLVLQNNAGSDKTITENGDFTFGSNFGDKTSYAVTVLTHPDGKGCTISNSSGSVNGASVNNITVTCVDHANPTGYYEENGDATVDDGAGGTTSIGDLQAMVSGGRLMMLSMAENLVYDGTMTIVGNEYTATLTIYETGIKTDTTTVSGLIDAGSKITGTMTGTKYGSGEFTINYSTTVNSMDSVLSRIETDTNKEWTGAFVDSSKEISFEIDFEGIEISGTNPFDGIFSKCDLEGQYFVISGSGLYDYIYNATGCFESSVVNGMRFTGFATTQELIDSTLVYIYTNGEYAGYGEFIQK